MFFRKMILADQIFDDTYDVTIDSLIANIEALACTEKRTMIFINHRKSNIKVFHYNDNLFSLLGNSQEECDLLSKLNPEYDISLRLIDRYIEIRNSYI